MPATPTAFAHAGTTPPSIPNLPNDKAHPSQSSGEIPPHHGASSYYHHNNLSMLPVHLNVNVNECNAPSNFQGPLLHSALLQEGLSFLIACAPAPSYAPTQLWHSPSQSQAPLPHQTESQSQYCYPVPLYLQMVGSNTLLTAGYITYVQSNYQTNCTPSMTAVMVSSHSR